MGLTPGNKAALMKAPHASGRSATALQSQSAWSHSVCHLGDPDSTEHRVLLLLNLYQSMQA